MYWQNALPLLQKLAEFPRLGLITDMDGTLSPIVDQADRAQITPTCRELLRQLQPHLTTLAVVSGRTVIEVQSRLELPDVVYIGNHGLEHWVGDHAEIIPELHATLPRLAAAAQALRDQVPPDVSVEDKGATIAIHYRRSADPAKTAMRLRPMVEQAANQYALKASQGRMVFELKPDIDINKGTTFESLVTIHKLEAALYIGDDTTDIDALKIARKLRQDQHCYSVGVGVESPEMPEGVRENADMLVSGVSGVESLLDWLLKARQASSTCA